MSRRFGLGLRAQIVLALSGAFILSFTLLGIATVQLTQRAREIDRDRNARAAADVIAVAATRVRGDRREQTAALCDAVLDEGTIAGCEIGWEGVEPHVRGMTGGEVVARTFDGGEVRLHLRAVDPGETEPLSNLLLLYVAMTGGAILLLTFVALTYLIVRPVTAVTRASERLAAGAAHVEVPVRGAAEVARLATSFNAMASQLRAERSALEERLDELERAKAELEAAQSQVLRSERLASVGRLSAGVAHEIGNPLSAILGLVELLQDGDLDADDRDEFLRRIHGETERIHKIIRDLLDFSRQGDADGEGAATDLREVVADAASLVAPQKDLRDVQIERRFPEDLPAVRGSADRLTQVVLNLLLNAADAIEGEGTITVELEHEEGDDRVILRVSDDGPGIDPEVLDHLFEPFVTSKPTGQGTGLGLAVCHTVVERLGGTIVADNDSTGGAVFEVRLPVAPRPRASDT